MAIITVSTKGQIVIPKKVREILGLRPGAKVSVRLAGDEITLRPIMKNLPDRLFGKYRGLDLLADLQEEHGREVKGEIE